MKKLHEFEITDGHDRSLDSILNLARVAAESYFEQFEEVPYQYKIVLDGVELDHFPFDPHRNSRRYVFQVWTEATSWEPISRQD